MRVAGREDARRAIGGARRGERRGDARAEGERVHGVPREVREADATGRGVHLAKKKSILARMSLSVKVLPRQSPGVAPGAAAAGFAASVSLGELRIPCRAVASLHCDVRARANAAWSPPPGAQIDGLLDVSPR